MPRILFLVLLFVGSISSSLAQNNWERGKMKDGKPVGVWEYYDDYAGKELGVRFDYDSSRINFVKIDTSRYFVLVNTNWQTKRLTQAPRLVGSRVATVSAFQRKLRYPYQDLRVRREGSVVLSYIVDEQGKAGLPTVATAPSQTLAQEALRAADQLPMHYIPGELEGQRAQTKVFLVVRFCILFPEGQKEMQAEAQLKLHEQARLVPMPPGSFDEVIVTAFGAR